MIVSGPDCFTRKDSFFMNVGVAHSDENPNSSWLSNRGGWISYVLGMVIGFAVLLSIPQLELRTCWILASVIHSVVSYVMLHSLKGAPWENADQGKSRRLTHWEQIDYGEQLTDTRKFLTVVPIVLFLLTSYSTNYDWLPFSINFLSLLVCLVPKLPQLHKVRLFNINKY